MTETDGQSSLSEKPEPKWKRFEKLAYEIQKGLTPRGTVKLNDSIVGVDSRTNRQIDISIREQIGQFPILVVIDCKDHSEPIDVKSVEEFAGLAQDVRANRGAIISSNGFTEAAVTLARNRGIDTFRLVDTDSVDWGSYVTVNALLERTYMPGFVTEFAGTGRIVLPASGEELNRLELYSDTGESLGTAEHIVCTKWDRHEIPTEAGVYEVVVGQGVSVEFLGVKSRVDVSASVTVAKAYYLGRLPIHLKGLHDAQNGGIITKTVRTGEIDGIAIQHGEVPGWTEIEDPSKLSVKIMFRFDVSNCYTDEDPDAEQTEPPVQ